MPTHRVPLDSPQTNIIVDINGRVMNVIVADVKPHQIEGDAAHLSYMLDPDPDPDQPFFAIHSDTAPDQFTAVLSGRSTFAEVVNATHSSLMLMREDGFKSAIVPLTGLLAKRLGLDKEILMTVALLGIREFTDLMREKDYVQGISEIIIAAGSDVFQAWRGQKNLSLPLIFGERPENEEDVDIIPLVQPARQPNDIQRQWLETIGTHLDNLRQSLGDSQSTPTLPEQRHLTVVFEADTGNPFLVTHHMSPLKLQGLNPGEAAIDLEYVEIKNRAMIIVGKNIVGNIPSAPSPEVQDLIRGIRAFAPIFPTAQSETVNPGDGPQPITPNAEMDATNNAVVNEILELDSDNSETSAHELFMSVAGVMELATWWSMRSELSFEALNDMIVGRVWSKKRYSFSIDQSGRFADGTRSGVPSRAVNVEFRTYRDPASGLHKVPVNYDWHGPEGPAHEAFNRWYHSPIFLAARENMVLEDMLTETMFEGKDPYATVCALMAHLATRDGDRKKVTTQFCTVNGVPAALSGLFDKLAEGLVRIATGKSEMNAKKEVRIAFVEMLMRMSLGDAVVDKILGRTGGSSPQGPGSGPAPASGGTASSAGGNGASMMSPERLGGPYGWQQHMAPPPAPEIRGIVREEVKSVEGEDTVEIGLSTDDIAAIMAAENDCAASATNATVTSWETFLIATAPIAQA
jgi:hypothetical protein